MCERERETHRETERERERAKEGACQHGHERTLRRYPTSSHAGDPQEICPYGQNNGPGETGPPPTQRQGQILLTVTAQWSRDRNKQQL